MTKHHSDLSQENKEQDGLYHPSFEHDSCGIGFVANLNGSKSRNVVQGAITMLENMEHRGGQGAEPTSGDGAGILVQIPHKFLSAEVGQLGFALPEQGTYGVGNTFFPKVEHIKSENKHPSPDLRNPPYCARWDQMRGLCSVGPTPPLTPPWLRSASSQGD